MSIQQNINQMLSSIGNTAILGKIVGTAAKESEAKLKAQKEAKRQADIQTLQKQIEIESATLEHLKQPNQQDVKNITQKRYEQGVIIEQLKENLVKLDPSVLNKRELELAKIETKALMSATERYQKAARTAAINKKKAKKGGK